MRTSHIRINVRLSGDDAADFQALLAQSGHSVSGLLREALRSYRQQRLSSKPNPTQLLAGFIASGDGTEDLSVRYKHYLSQSLEHKFSATRHTPQEPGQNQS